MKLNEKKKTGQYATEEAVSQLTVEVNAANVLEQLFASRVLHLGADPWVVSTEVLVHVVERVCHGVHGIDHELHLPLLLIVRVFANSLLPCTLETHRYTHRRTVRSSACLMPGTNEPSWGPFKNCVVGNTMQNFEL